MKKAKITFDKINLLRAGVLVASLFFVVLGMRNPYLNHNSGPKQRPRAVIENVSKSFEEVEKKVVHAVDVNPPVLPSIAFITCSRVFSLASQALPEIAVSHLIARAPPLGS